MSCSDSYKVSEKPKVGNCPDCGSDTDEDGQSCEESCCYGDECPACGYAACDLSC